MGFLKRPFQIRKLHKGKTSPEDEQDSIQQTSESTSELPDQTQQVSVTSRNDLGWSEVDNCWISSPSRLKGLVRSNETSPVEIRRLARSPRLARSYSGLIMTKTIIQAIAASK